MQLTIQHPRRLLRREAGGWLSHQGQKVALIFFHIIRRWFCGKTFFLRAWRLAAAWKMCAMRFLSARPWPGLMLFQGIIQRLRRQLGVQGIHNSAVKLEPGLLFLDEQGHGRGQQPTAKKWVRQRHQQANHPAKARFEVALDGGFWQSMVLPDLPGIPGGRTVWLGGRQPVALEDMNAVVDIQREQTQ